MYDFCLLEDDLSLLFLYVGFNIAAFTRAPLFFEQLWITLWANPLQALSVPVVPWLIPYNRGLVNDYQGFFVDFCKDKLLSITKTIDPISGFSFCFLFDIMLIVHYSKRGYYV